MLFNLVTAFAVLFCSVQGVAIAHTHAIDAPHAAEVVVLTGDVADADHDADSSSSQKSGDVAHHHHCSAGLAQVAPGYCFKAAETRSTHAALLVPELASLTGPPPTEPPSA